MSSGNAASTRTERISLYVSVAAATVGICTFAWYRSCYPLCSRNDPAAEDAGDKAEQDEVVQGGQVLFAEQQPAQPEVANAAIAALERVLQPHQEGDEVAQPLQASAMPWAELLDEDDEPDVPIPVRVCCVNAFVTCKAAD